MIRVMISLLFYALLPSAVEAKKITLNTQAELMQYFDGLNEQDFETDVGYNFFLHIKSKLKTKKILSIDEEAFVERKILAGQGFSYLWLLNKISQFTFFVSKRDIAAAEAALIGLFESFVFLAGTVLYRSLWTNYSSYKGTVSFQIYFFNHLCAPVVPINKSRIIFLRTKNYFVELPDERAEEKAVQKVN